MAEEHSRLAGAAVLKSLYKLAGEPSYARLIQRGELLGESFSQGTITNLLTGNRSSRPRTVRAFVRACVELAPKKAAWPQETQTAQEWIAAYDTACGRTSKAAEPNQLVRVGVLPLSAAAFQPRAELVALLGRVVDEGKIAVLAQPVHQAAHVLSGLGGVGKSQLVAHYARQQWHDPDVNVIVWASAAAVSGIVEAYAEAAAHLFGGGGGDAEQDARRFLSWVASTPKRWLIVLDDLQVPGDLAGWRPPVTATGQTVITTRYRGDAFDREDIELIPVDVFTAEESVAYLRERLSGHTHLVPDTDVELAGLAEDLGFLPLALAQATAFIVNDATPVDVYRGMVADQRRGLEDLVPAKDELPDGHQATIDATWALSIHRANATAPKGVAWPLLQIAALLEPTGIPEGVFAAEAIINSFSEALALNPPLNPHDVRRGLAVLHRYHLVTVDPGSPQRAVTVHGLVQRATRAATNAPVRREDVAYAVADALYDIWPVVDTTSELGAILRANTTALIACAGEDLWDPFGHMVLFRLSRSLGEAGLIGPAVDHAEALHSTAANRLGADHQNTLRALSDVAMWRGYGGDVPGAVTIFDQLVPDVIRVFGPDDPQTLVVQNLQAVWRVASGDLAGAAAVLEQLLPDAIRVLGAEHPDTLRIRGNIVSVQAETDRAAGGIAAMERVLADQVQTLGPNHPDTLTLRFNIATTRGNEGDAAGAAAAFAEILADRLRVLGPDHPNTMLARNNLARWRGEAGDAAGAVEVLEQLLTDQLRVLGPDHPDTLVTHHDLAGWRGEAGDAAGAAAALSELLAEVLRKLPPEHELTGRVRHGLAYWEHHAGRADGAPSS